MNILQSIFTDYYEHIIYELHPRPAVMENVNKMIHCGDSSLGGAMYACPHCGNLKFDRWDVQIVLILLYSGMRVNELLLNTKDHLNIEDRTLYISDAKNKQSIRYVPIHEAVFPLLMNFYDRATDKLMVNPNGTVVTYNNFAVRNLQQINELLEVKHKMHDTRHTFITWGHRYALDEFCLKRIVGHTAGNITQDTYTHTSVEELHRELTKIPKCPY